MRLPLQIASALVAVVLAFGLAAVPAVAAPDSDREMSIDRAGRVWVQQVCRSVDASDRFNDEVLRGKRRIYKAEVRRRLPELRRHAARLSRGYYAVSEKLANPPAKWPEEIKFEAKQVAYATRRYGLYMKQASRARKAQGFINGLDLANHLIGLYQDEARKVQRGLGLPKRFC